MSETAGPAMALQIYAGYWLRITGRVDFEADRTVLSFHMGDYDDRTRPVGDLTLKHGEAAALLSEFDGEIR